MQKDMLFWIWLSEALGTSNRDFRTLFSLYDNPYELFLADAEELDRIEGLSPHCSQKLADKDLTRATAILDSCERLGISVLPYNDPAYPNALREIKRPPVLLYYRGRLPDLQKRLSIAMVGTRRMSAYGMRSAYKIAYELAATGVIVVSGMAAGIDGVAAAAALAAEGETVAILGCGLDVVYPRHHKKLMDMIAQKGVLFSEYPPGTKPNHYHFPARNRLISGLSQGTVVVEAGVGSGSLITAKDAIVQGRDVFALPANVGSQGAEGTNGLLKDGARLALSSADILEPYQYVYAETLRLAELSKSQSASNADLRYLESLGVIELTPRKASEKETLRAAPEPMTEKKKVGETKKAEKAKQERKESVSDAPSHKEAMSQSPVEKKKTPDEVLSSLTPVQLAIMQAIPDDRAITMDQLTQLGYPHGDVIAALTMLEILGLIQKLPGALYTKS